MWTGEQLAMCRVPCQLGHSGNPKHSHRLPATLLTSSPSENKEYFLHLIRIFNFQPIPAEPMSLTSKSHWKNHRNCHRVAVGSARLGLTALHSLTFWHSYFFKGIFFFIFVLVKIYRFRRIIIIFIINKIINLKIIINDCKMAYTWCYRIRN